MKRLLFFIPIIIILFASFNKNEKRVTKQEKPKLCISFDDGSIADMPGYTINEWNKLLLKNLSRNKLQAIFFATGKGLDNEKGKKILELWNSQGHLIANHTYSHNSYNNVNITVEEFSKDFLKTIP